MSIQNLDPNTVVQTMQGYRPGTGSERYIDFIHEILGARTGIVQKILLRALEENRRTIAVGANGVGKSYGIGGLGSIAGLYCNLDCTVNVTSGSYGQLDDTIWKPIKSIHRSAPLPGRTLDNKRELKSGLDEEWYLKCLSPRYPADLEGRHNRRMIYIVEEADKPGITAEHIDSIESTMTDSGDRVIVLANPPKDEANVVAELMDSEKWDTINFSSFESLNVQIDIGAKQKQKIPGLVELSEIKENWEDWNGEDWPGYHEAFEAHRNRQDLDQRWYRRRVGIMPKSLSTVHRPFKPSEVQDAYFPNSAPSLKNRIPDAAGLDVARDGGDFNVFSILIDGVIVTEQRWNGVDHTVNEAKIRKYTDDWPHYVPLVVDAQGEGSGLADRLKNAHPGTVRFNAGSLPKKKNKYYSCWEEGIDLFGTFLREGGKIENKLLREESLIASRTLEYEEKYYKSRNDEVLKLNSKDDIAESLGRSPDILDSAYMAIWGAHSENTEKLTW